MSFNHPFLYFIFFFNLFSSSVEASVYLYNSTIYVGEETETAGAGDARKTRAAQASPFFEGIGASSQPYTVYIPIDTDPYNQSATGSREKNTFFGNKMALTSFPDGPLWWDQPVLPTVSAPITGSYPPSFDNDPYLRVGVYHNADSNKYICAAIKSASSGDYKMVRWLDVEITPNSVSYLRLYFEDMNNVDHAILNVDERGKSIDETATLYVFEVPPNTNPKCSTHGAVITPESYPNGLYFKLRFNSTVEENAPRLISLQAGDTYLNAKFDATNTGTINRDIERVMLVSLRANNVAETPNPGDVDTFLELSDYLFNNRTSNMVFYNPVFSGVLKTGSLANGIGYRVGVVTLSKFRFASKPSNFILGNPQSIDTFIQEQSCYLLSAGFGEKHFVIEYFKIFRDQILNKFWAGKLFINFYYDTAPQFAPVIYKSRLLSMVVRTLGYSLYFICKTFFIWCPIFLIILTVWTWQWRARCKKRIENVKLS